MSCRSQIAVSARTEPYAELRIFSPGTARSSLSGSLRKNSHSLHVYRVMSYPFLCGPRGREADLAARAAYMLDQKPEKT